MAAESGDANPGERILMLELRMDGACRESRGLGAYVRQLNDYLNQSCRS